MIKCPHCGGEVGFDPSKQTVTCPYCRSDFDPTKLNVTVKHAKERKNPLLDNAKSYSCSQCGATLMTFDDTAITFCSYCGSQAMLEDKIKSDLNPDYVIPFSKTKEQCIQAYKNKLSSTAFVPDYMKEDIVVEKFRGIFMPYAIYQLQFKGKTKNNGSVYTHRKGDYKYYDDYDVTSDVDAEYIGMSYDLASNFYDKFSMSIPFNYQERKEFNPNYLSGFYADTSNVSGEVYDNDALSIVAKDSSKRMTQNKEFKKYGCYNPYVPFKVSDRKIAMFPVYFLAIRTKDNKSINYAVVNGQTGKVAMDMPVDFKKYIKFSLIVAIILFLLINWLVVLKASTVCFLGIIAGLTGMIISLSQISKINSSRYHLDDKGYFYANKNQEIVKVKKFQYIFKDLLAMIIPTLVLIFNFTSYDLYYYLGAILSLVLVLISFKDLVEEHNLLSSNKIPQLEKRGGDEK